MKSYSIYECEKCGKQSKSYNDIFKCEAEHMGLTIREKIKYDYLKEQVRVHSDIVTRSNNNRTRSNLNIAVEELIAFEEKYDLN